MNLPKTVAIKESRMKPFDLKAALEGAKVIHVQRNLMVSNLAKVGNRVAFTIAQDGETVYSCDSDGFAPYLGVGDSPVLVMAPFERTVWVNLYERLVSDRNFGYFYDTEEEADSRVAEGVVRLGGKSHAITIFE